MSPRFDNLHFTLFIDDVAPIVAHQVRSSGNKLEFVLDADATDHALSCRTFHDVILETPSGIGFLRGGDLKVVVDPDVGDLKNASHFTDMALHIGLKTVGVGSDFFSGQHAGQGTHHSSGHSPNDMVEGGSVFLHGIDPVEFLNPPVDPVINRL